MKRYFELERNVSVGKSPPTLVTSLPSGSAREEGLLPDEAGDALPWMDTKMSRENRKQRGKKSLSGRM